MAERTERFGFTVLNRSKDRLEFEGYRPLLADRQLLDSLLKFAAEDHDHDGVGAPESVPTEPVAEVISSPEGLIPSGADLFYRTALVDAKGHELPASPVVAVVTPNGIPTPGPVGVALVAGTGLRVGRYAYKVTVRVDSAEGVNSRNETLASLPTPIIVNPIGSVTLTLPTLPPGASDTNCAFNVYRKGPSDQNFRFLAECAEGDTTYIDDGTVTPTSRIEPTKNTSFANNAVRIDFEADELLSTDDYTWKIYRSYDRTNWNNTFIAIIEDATTYTDIGRKPRRYLNVPGRPLEVTSGVGGAEQIVLTDVEEVMGYLPPGRNVIPIVVDIEMDNLGDYRDVWVSEFDQCDIQAVRMVLEEGDVAAADVVFTIYRSVDGGDTWVDVLAGEPDYPFVPAGEFFGDLLFLTSVVHLDAGEMIAADFVGSANPGTTNYYVTALALARYGSTTVSHDWSS